MQVDEPDRKRCQDFTQNKRRKLFDEHLSRFIEFDNIFQRLLVELNEAIVISSPIGIVFRQSVRIERPDEDTVKSVFPISIDNLPRKAERILRGRHQCGNPAFAQFFANLCNTGNNTLIAVRFSPVVVVQVQRAVKRSRDNRAILSAQIEQFVRQIDAIGTNYIGKFAVFGQILLFGIFDGPADEMRDQRRLASLKLHCQARGRRTKHQIDGMQERLFAHIILIPATFLTGCLTINTVLVTAKCQHKDMQRSKMIEKCLAGSQTDRHRVNQPGQRFFANKE